MSLRGLSAVGWLFPQENDVLPLLEVVDAYNRTAGMALTLVHNFAGETFWAWPVVVAAVGRG